MIKYVFVCLFNNIKMLIIDCILSHCIYVMGCREMNTNADKMQRTRFIGTKTGNQNPQGSKTDNGKQNKLHLTRNETIN